MPSIKKGYALVFRNCLTDNETAALTEEAEKVYYTSVKRKKKIANFIDRKHIVLALPYKGLVIVTTALKSAKTVVFAAAGNIIGPSFIRYDKDDSFTSPLANADGETILYNIDYFDGLYYETNRPETLLEETTKFYRVVSKTGLEASLVYENKTNIPLLAKLTFHTPNTFAVPTIQNLYSHNLARLYTDFLFETFVERIGFMGVNFKGVSRFPTALGGQPPTGVKVLSIYFDYWNDTYERNDIAVQANQTNQIGFITSIQYVLDMLADMNKPYADKQYSAFAVDFTFVKTDPLPTEYIIPIPEYGDVSFTYIDCIYTSVDFFPTDVGGLSTSQRLIIHVNLFSDDFNLVTNTVTRSIKEATLSIGLLVIVFNTDQYEYTIDFLIRLVSLYDTTDTSFYDSASNERTRYINGNDAYARIGVKLATLKNFPLNPGTLSITDGAQTDVLAQYELSPSGIIPSTRFLFYTTTETSDDDFGITRTRSETFSYIVVNSINAGTLIRNTVSAFDSSVAVTNGQAQLRTVSFGYAIPPHLNPHYAFTWENRVGSGDFGLLSLIIDGSLTWAVITIIPSIFGDSVLLGEAQSYEGATEGGLTGYRANYRLITPVDTPIISSLQMTDLLKDENQTTISFGTPGNELSGSFPPDSHKYYPSGTQTSSSDLIHEEADFRSVSGVPGGQEAQTNRRSFYAFDERKVAEIPYYDPAVVTYGSTSDRYEMRIIPAIVEDLINVQSSSIDHLSRYYFVDKDFNLLGKLVFKWDTSAERNLLVNALISFEFGARKMFDIYTKYRNTDFNTFPLEIDDIDELNLQITRRTILEAELEKFLIFNDFASFSLMLVCANSFGGTNIDNYIMIEDTT